MALQGYPTTRDSIPSALEANLRKYFLERLSKISGFYEQIYNVDTSDIKVERQAVYAGLGTFAQKAEGDAVAWDSGQEAWNQSYTHNGFALGVQVTREAIDDDLHGVIRQMTARGGDLAAVASYTKERDALNLFNTLLTSGTVYTAGGSNYSLLSTSHYRTDGGTWSNRPTVAMDLSIEALEFMIGHWLVNQLNQRGQIVGTYPERLMVGAGDVMLAQRLIRSTGLPTTNNNDPNVVRDHLKDVLTHPLLTNDGRWLGFGPKEETGLQYYERKKPNVERWPDDGNTGNFKFVCLYRESHGATHVSNIWGSP